MKSKILLTFSAAVFFCAMLFYSMDRAPIALAQQGQQFELACPPGTNPLADHITLDQATGLYRAWGCIDLRTGKITLQPDAAAGAIPSLPIDLTASMSGLLPAAHGGTGDATGNAPTATALAAAPTTCGAGVASTGISASGTAQGCFTPSSGSTVIQLTSDCAVTGVTMTACTGMDFTAASSTNYRAQCVFFKTVSAGTAEYSWTGPASPTLIFYTELNSSAAPVTAFATTENFLFSGGTSGAALSLINGTNSGTVQLEIANATAGDVTTLKAGSFCVIQ